MKGVLKRMNKKRQTDVTENENNRTDMTLDSIRTTGFKQFAVRSVHFGIPVVTLAAFAVVLSNASKIDESISGRTASTDCAVPYQTEAHFDDPVDESEKVLPEPVPASKPAVTAAVSEKVLKNDESEAVGVYVDGKYTGCVSDGVSLKKELENRIEKIRHQAGVTDAQYRYSVEYVKGIYPTEDVTDISSLLAKLEEETDEQYYTVNEGDTLYSIAEYNGISVGYLLEMNPELYEDPDMLYEGMEIMVAERSRILPVIVTKEVEEQTVIPYSTLTIDSEFLPVGETELLVSGENGTGLTKFLISYEDEKEIKRSFISTRMLTPPVDEQISVGIECMQNQAAPDTKETVLKGSGRFMWPVDGGSISDVFISNRNHKGLDIAAPEGREIYAAADGKVITAGWNSGGYGNYVIIDHGDGFITLYAHMSKVLAVSGTEVKCGEVIGRIGSTGDSTGPHCHFEVRENNICKNPADYLKVNADTPAEEKESGAGDE